MKLIAAVLAAVLLVAASVAVTLYVTSDSRSGISHARCPVTNCDPPKEGRFLCDHTNNAAVEVEVTEPLGGSSTRRYEC